MTIDQRRKARDRGKDALIAYKKANPNLAISSAKLQILIERLQEMAVYSQYGNRFFAHPFPTVAEPKKKFVIYQMSTTTQSTPCLAIQQGVTFRY